MKNKGFSLMEICVAIGLLGIMLSIGGPKIRNYVVVAQNMKAIATIETLRTASELYYSETGTTPFSPNPSNAKSTTLEGIKKLKKYLDSKTFKRVENGRISIGGSKATRTDESGLNYGGTIAISPQPPKDGVEKLKADGIYLWFAPTDEQKYDHNNKEWSSF